MKRSFGQRLIGVFGIEVVSGILRLCVPLLMARAIGANSYGLYAAGTNLTFLIFNLAASGLPLAAMYYSATSPGRATARRLLGCAVGLATAAVCVAIPLVFLFRTVVDHGQASSMLLLSATVASIPYSVELTALGMLRGQGRNEGASLFGLLRQTFLIATAGLIGWFGGGPEKAVLAFGLSTIAVAAVAGGSAFFSSAPSHREPPPALLDIARYSGQVQSSTLLTFLNYRLTLFLVAALAPGVTVGIYAAALTIAESVWIFSHIVSSALVGEVAGKQPGARTRTLTARACRLVTGASALTALVAGCLSRFLMGLFGAEFVAGWSTLVVLLLAAAVLAPSRVLATHQAALGSPRSNIRGTAIGLIVNVLLAGALLPVLGLLGAAVASVVSYAVIAGDRIRTFLNASAGEETTIERLLLPRLDDFRTLARALPMKSSGSSAVIEGEH